MIFTFSNREKKILDALSETIIPPGGVIPFSAGEMNVSNKIEMLCNNLHKEARQGFKLMLNIINLLPLLTHGKTFLKMNFEARKRFLEGIENSGFLTLRNIMIAIKGFICLVYYNSPEVQKIIGYSPECLKE